MILNVEDFCRHEYKSKKFVFYIYDASKERKENIGSASSGLMDVASSTLAKRC